MKVWRGNRASHRHGCSVCGQRGRDGLQHGQPGNKGRIEGHREDHRQGCGQRPQPDNRRTGREAREGVWGESEVRGVGYIFLLWSRVCKMSRERVIL